MDTFVEVSQKTLYTFQFLNEMNFQYKAQQKTVPI